MISLLKGNLVSKTANEIVLDVNGVGYSVFVTRKVRESLPETGNTVSVITYLDVKENSLMLFGFADEKEREIFKMLMSVSGISAKTAHIILTHASFEEIVGLISSKSAFASIKIPGIGPKKIEMISLALKDKIFKISSDFEEGVKPGTGGIQDNDMSRLEALNALMNLGYQRSDAERIIREVLKENQGEKLSTEDIIKKSLNHISRI
ncbi:MAG: Holliday junction branch migration protein RuvA [Ignavibacteria bacterium]|nr:Holliday junction branch migration protein RuvA [Ignavibacteria bacterium]